MACCKRKFRPEHQILLLIPKTVKPDFSGHSKRRPKIGFKTDYHLMKVKILQYFQSSLSYHLSLRSLFCLFLSGCVTKGYCTSIKTGFTAPKNVLGSFDAFLSPAGFFFQY